MNMKIALGTAQFGLDYGVANSLGKIPSAEARKILNLTKIYGVDTLDTATIYGESEAFLGQEGVSAYKVVTKLPQFPEVCEDIEGWVFEQAFASIQRLKINKLYGLLLHKSVMLNGVHGERVFKSLEILKEQGKVEKIGVSVYSPSELEYLVPRYKIDLIQLPLNIIDQTMRSSGWLTRLKDLEVEIHARSIFMQGLLLMDRMQIPTKFKKWSELWDVWDTWTTKNKISRLEACLNFSMSIAEIDKLIVGVDSSAQLNQIIEVVKNKNILDNFPNITCTDESLINPSNWGAL